MRRLLLASTALLALSGTARAQFAVIDAANLVQSVQTVAQSAQQVQQLIQQLQVMRQQYNQLIQTYQAIAHTPDGFLATAEGVFDIPSLRSPVPGQATDLSAIVGGLAPLASALAPQVTQMLGANRIYAPVGTDASALAMTTNAASIAGTQAMATQLYQSATDHAAALWSMESELSNSPDAKATADIQARLQLEQAHLQVRAVQAQTLGTAQAAQARETAQQHEESRRCYIDAILNGSDPTVDNCARPASQGGVQMASVGAGGVSISSSYSQYVGQSVGSGQCVALVQQADSSVGLTATWTQGAQVQGNTDLAPGTAIATFDGSGKYANATDGSSHAAIYLGQDAAGNIQVEDQWLGHPASVRTIQANGSSQANSGSAFYVIGHSGA